MGISGEKLEKVGGNGKNWGKVGKVAKGGVKCFFLIFEQNGRRRPFWMSENNF